MPRTPRLHLTCLALLAVLCAGAASAATPGTRMARAPWGTGQSRGEDLEITLVTFGPGGSVESWFGHTALVVEDRRLGQRRLYNYGMFHFGPDMLPKYAMGRLEFWVEDTHYVTGTYRFYASQDRHVRLQRLNLSPGQRATLAQMLDENVQPGNATYLYHHYYDNCSTRPRDIIDRATGGALRKVGQAPARMTLREHTRRHTDYFPPMSVLLDFLMNDEIDKPITVWDEAFLPAELESLVAQAKVTLPGGATGPLVAHSEEVHRARRPDPPPTPPNYAPVMLALGLVAGGLGAVFSVRHHQTAKRRWRVLLGGWNVLIGLLLGLPGTVLFLMWMFTEHTVAHRNENLFLANPLTLLALPLGILLMRGSPRAGRLLRGMWLALAGLGTLGLLLKVLPLFDQDNWRLIAFILPISVGMAAASVVYEAARQRAAAPVPASR